MDDCHSAKWSCTGDTPRIQTNLGLQTYTEIQTNPDVPVGNRNKIMLMGILPRPESGDPGNLNVDATKALLSQVATTSGSVQFVNLRNVFVDASGNTRSELYQADRLHLSDAGYQAWADGLKSALK